MREKVCSLVVVLAAALATSLPALAQVAPSTGPATEAPATVTPATQPAMAAANDAPELIQSKSQMVGYGAEVARIVSQPDEIVSILRNGTTVIVKRVASPVVSVRGYCETGGVYEGKWLGGGLSHLLEHLVAGGSSERRTEAENKALLQRIGNESNAYTSEDHTCFFVNTTVPHLDEAVDLVTGWMLGAKITVPEYRREYQVVQRELERGKGQPDSVFWDLYLLNRYHVSPARVPVIGYQEVIQGLSRDDVYSYYKLAYQPNNMVFCVVGDVEPRVMLDAVRKYVSDSKPGRVFSHDIVQEPAVTTPRTIVATFPRLGSAHLDLSFPTVAIQSPDLYALDLLATVLGGGESSLLVEQLRDRDQLVNTISCNDWTPAFVDGALQIDMQLAPANIKPATDEITKILTDIVANGVDPDRIARAKTEMRMARLQGLQTSEEISASLATDFIQCGDPHFSDLYVDRVMKVTPQQVQDVARRYLDAQRLVTTAIVPSEAVGSGGLPKAVDLLRQAVPTTQSTPAQTITQANEPSAVQRKVLPNGTVLLLKRVTTTPLITAQMYALGGVTAEDKATNGLGNLAMTSLNRGTTSRSAEQIAVYMDSIGGGVGASCGNNTWSWNLSCDRDHFAQAFDVFADVVNHPTFAPDQLAEMKQRIEAQIAGQDADWHAQAFRFFKQCFYGPEHSPYQFMPIGTPANVEAFTPAQVKDWYTQHVLKAPRVIAIYGDLDPQQATDLATRLIGGGDPLPSPTKIGDFQPLGSEDQATPSVNVTGVEVQKSDQGPAGIVIGFNSGSVIGDPLNDVATRAYTLCAGYGYPTGYIFETLRGLGLVYEAAAYDSPGRMAKTPGGFIAYAGCDPSKVNEVVSLMLLNIARLQGTDADMQTDWFNRSRYLITTSEAMANETPAAQATQAALDELLGLGYDYHKTFDARIGAVSIDQVRSYARSKLRNCIVTVCTPDPDAVKVPTGQQQYPTFPPVDLTPRGVQHDTGAPR